jgi:hypothetical protein
MRRLLAGILIACASLASAVAQVSVGVSIGMHLPVYPQLVAVPGYPVYYAPALNANFFFYDGMYWVYQGDHWYMSAWYNGPWTLVSPLYVPPYVLRVPVRYYRLPPPYFRPWRADAPPRWGEHWGDDWQRHRKGWDQWNRAAVPPPAPLPVYQRQYSGDRYPQQVERQHYRYQPREPVVRREYRAQAAPVPVRSQPQGAAPDRGPQSEDPRRTAAPPSQARLPQGKGAPPPPQGQGQGQGKGRDKGEERGQGGGKPQ